MKETNNYIRFLLFSCILFVIISIGTFMAYIFSARQINRSYVEQQLAVAGESINLQLEREISSELSLITKLGYSPIVREYFLSPDDPVLRMYAIAELDQFQQHSSEGLVFWISDIDKLFYATGTEPFLFDPDNPENYWYNMTLYETEDYNFNINYNNDLEVINLWINVPVYAYTDDNSRKPVGMLGTGLNLTKITQIVDSALQEHSRNITAYLFNQFQEITIATDFDLILNKVLIEDHLRYGGSEAIRVVESIIDDRGQNYIYGDYMYRVCSISAIKDWNIVLHYPLPGILALNQPMNVVFFGMMFLIILLFIIMNIFVARSEHATREQKRISSRIEAIISSLPGMVYEHLNNFPDFTLTYVSEGSKTLIGYEPRELIGGPNKFMAMVHPDDMKSIAEMSAQTINVGQPWEHAYRIIMQDGSIKWVLDRMTILKGNNNDTSDLIEGYMFDITEQKQLEIENAARLETAANEALELSRAKSDFLARMSHEIRTPMNAIIGIAQIQLQKDDLSRDYALALEKIYSSGSGLLGIINDILDLSKIETGKMEINPVEYDLSSLINDTVQLNIVRIESKPIEFILEIDQTLPSKLIGDELRIKQILNNLLSNAFKYTEKGYIKLKIKHTVIEEDIILWFTVEDTGQGMMPQDCQRLFSQDYLRFNLGANRTTEGTGIGLNITNNLIELMEGTIAVESEYRKGSIFTVSIKQKIVNYEAIGAELAHQLCNFTFSGEKQYASLKILREPMPFGKVLIVDDVETNLYVAQGLMSPYGLEIETAINGYSAIEKVENGSSYDVIFMDHMMPHMDGIETTQKLRSMGYCGVIIALTANALAGNDVMFRQSGFDDFISKPIDVRQLNMLLNKFVRDRHSKENWEQVNSFSVNKKLLEIFCRDAEKAIITLQKLDLSSEIKLFITTVHAMKSALGNIGEKEKSQSAYDLENAGLEGNFEFINANIENFIYSLESLIKNIKSKFPNSKNYKNEDQEDIQKDFDFLKEQLKIIVTACEKYDDEIAYAALALLEDKKWPNETSKKLEEIRDTLFLHSDFEKASNFAKSMLENYL